MTDDSWSGEHEMRERIAELEGALEKIEDVTRYVPNEYAKEANQIARIVLAARR